MSLAGLLCIFAAAIKFAAACGGCPTYCLFGSCTVTLLVSIAETVVGVFLIYPGDDELRRIVCLIAFAILLLASTGFAVMGESCNCLGAPGTKRVNGPLAGERQVQV